jgi:hypothetical protein
MEQAMIDVPVILILMAFCLLAVKGAYNLGVIEGKRARNADDVTEFIKQFWPDREAAYQRGIKEGYEQAMRDHAS